MSRETNVTREFARRLRFFRSTMALVALSWILTIFTYVIPFGGLFGLAPEMPAVFLGVSLILMIVLAVAMKRHRCPACGAVPVDEEGDVTLSAPANCRSCKVRLRA